MTRPLITHITTVHSRNDIRIAVKECRSLQGAGLGLVILIVADGRGEGRENGLEVLDVGRPGSGRLGRMIIGGLRMWRKARRLCPAVVHFHDPELIWVGLLLKISGFKVIYDIHEDLPLQIMSKDWIPWMLRKPLARGVRIVEGLSVHIFDALVPATPSIARRFDARKTVLVQNHPISREFTPSSDTLIRDRPQAFAYAGGISRIRGAWEMVQALDHFSHDSGVRLELAGVFDPPDLGAELQSHPEWNKVHWHGWVDRPQLAQILSTVRAGLLLFHPVQNHLKAQPNKMFEYMAAGLPVIASDFPLWREIIDHAGCGLLVDPLQPRAIAGAMQWMLDNPEQARAMGRRGRAAVEQCYTWEREAEKLVGLYADLLGRKKEA